MVAKLTLIAAISSLLLSAASVDAWTLKSTLAHSNFEKAFTYFTDPDPTHGFVDYVDQATAKSSKLFYTKNNQIIIKTDNTTVTPNGRPSVRLVSKASYNSGLFLLDLEHMPTGCGTWPAFWMVGPDWPNGGEIDIIEGVNKQLTNAVTLHTSDGCTMAGVKRKQTGTVAAPNCYVNAPDQYNNAGCGVDAPKSNTYGVGLNKIKGGVYATSWTQKDGVQVWFFPRNLIPKDIKSGKPNSKSWGTPIATFPFGSSCPSSKFHSLQIVINLTFCGDWAGNVYGQSGCPGTCTSFVQNNPHAFNEAYWKINSLKIFQ